MRQEWFIYRSWQGMGSSRPRHPRGAAGLPEATPALGYEYSYPSSLARLLTPHYCLHTATLLPKFNVVRIVKKSCH